MANRLTPINLGAPGEEISQKDLREVVRRFKLLNQGRLQRVQEFYQGRQQDFLNLLPLIFHINHPLLPGFVSLETPAGIWDYYPSKQSIDTAKKYSKGFVYKPKALRSHQIHGIFLMGSVGSVAFSRESDIDIWLCYQPGLDANALDELTQKAREVEKWALTLQIEVHFFPIDNAQFKQGGNTPISAESSGETQHYLLLEEFYRTSIYIAGRTPIWWQIPPVQEKYYQQYVTHLMENRFIAEADICDFGGLENMPQAEFVSATLWHIYKSLNSPHKSLLKLFLMESYASEFPDPQWVCLTMKTAIFEGDFNIDALDPYLLIYGKVDRYLQSHGSKPRLDLARECFHLKIMGSSSNALAPKTRQLREDFMQSVAEKWQWPPGFLENLSVQKNWNIQKACAEHAVIRDQLQNCLRMILRFSGSQLEENTRENTDLKLIIRKLRAALDLRPGKLEVLTTRFMVRSPPHTLAFIEELHDNKPVWRLYTDILHPSQTLPEALIKQCDSLLELLCWAVVNRLYQKHINLKLVCTTLKISNNEFYALVNELNEFFSAHLRGKEHNLELYEKPNLCLSTLLLINLGENLAIDVNSQQFAMSERSDPFSYGDNRLCFIQTVQKISISAWGEVHVSRYSGLEGFFQCIAEIFNLSEPPLNPDKFHAVCFTMIRGRSILWRVKAMFANLLKYFARLPVNVRPRYMLAGEHAYYVFYYQDNLLKFYQLDNHQQLLEELGRPQVHFSPVLFDVYVLSQTFIPMLYQYNAADKIQVFFYAVGKHVSIYVIDEKGALFSVQHANVQTGAVLSHYWLFLGNLLKTGKISATISVNFYEIQKNSTGVVSCHPVDVNQASADKSPTVSFSYDAAAGAYAIVSKDFVIKIENQQGYQQAKNLLHQDRKYAQTDGLLLTEIDVPISMLGGDHAEQIQTVQYLRYKQRIEDKFRDHQAAEGYLSAE